MTFLINSYDWINCGNLLLFAIFQKFVWRSWKQRCKWTRARFWEILHKPNQPLFRIDFASLLGKEFFFLSKISTLFLVWWLGQKTWIWYILIWYSAWLSFFEEEKTSTMLELVSEIFVSKWWNLIRFIFHWNRPIRRRSKKKTGQSEIDFFNFIITLFLFAEAVKVRPIVV